MTRVPPSTIIAGLGTLDREEICDLLAIFQDTGLMNLARDRFADVASAIGKRKKPEEKEAAFKKRLAETSANLSSSAGTDGLLRLRLWAALKDTFDGATCLPLSVRAAAPAAADLAHGATVALAGLIPKPAMEGEGWKGKAKSLASKITSIFGEKDRATFDDVIAFQAIRLTAQAAEKGLLDEAVKSELVRKIRERLSNLPPELRDEAVEHALKMGDMATLGLLASGWSLVGLGIAVDMAGFAAYQLAAQASAFLPLIGGKAAVSGLFILANPLFIIPALIGGGILMGRSLHDSVRERLAASLIVLLALRGLANGHNGLQTCLDGFRGLNSESFDMGDLGDYADILHDVRTRSGGSLPPCPAAPPENLALPASSQGGEALAAALFAGDAGGTAEAIALAGLTIGDIVYSATSIDPNVIAAVDFSSSKDLDDIFRFGAFATSLGDYSDTSLAGVENRLCGYVAERVVAARLIEQGHQIDWPETANSPGFDLFVDGEEFQVKCLSGIGGLEKHFKNYPDIPVIANADLVDQVSDSGADWADMVHYVEGYDYEVADHLLHQGLEAGSDLMNVHFHIPLFAAAVSSARNLHGWWKGSIPLSNLPFEIAVGGAVKGGLAVAGGLAGKGLGLLLFGPAGAVIGGGLGGVASVMGRGRVRSTIDGLVAPAWSKETALACDAFVKALTRALERKVSLLNRKLARLANDKREEARWVTDRIADDRLFVIEGLCCIDSISRSKGDIQNTAQAALRIMHDYAVHPWSVHDELSALLNVLNSKPTAAAVAAEASLETARRGKQALQRAWRTRFRAE
jgi:hypothetical protein